MKRLAIYYRVSTQRQKGNLRSQFNIENGIQYAKDNGYQYDIFDDAKSGSDFNRPEWIKCYDKLLNNEFDALWIPEVDRLGRNDIEMPIIYSFLESNNISLIVGNKVYDYENLSDEFLFKIESLFSGIERKKIKKRTLEAKFKEKNDGKIRFCRVYGYSYKKNSDGSKKWFPVPEQVEVIKIIFKLFLDHGYGLFDISKYLNQKGYKPLKADQWERSTVSAILKRIEYTGFTFNKAGIEIKHHFYTEEMVSLDDWKRVQTRFKKQITDNTRRGRNAEYPASNIVKCGKCGSGFYYHEGKRILANGTQKWIRQYAHKFDYRTNQDKCSQAPKYIDFYLLNDLCHEVFEKEMNAGTENLQKIVSDLQLRLDRKKDELRASKERLELRLKENSQKQKNLNTALESAEDVSFIVSRLNELTNQKKDYLSELKDIELALQDDQERIEKMLADFSLDKKVEYQNATGKERRELLKNILESCTIIDKVLTFKMITGNEYIYDIGHEKKKRWQSIRKRIYLASTIKYYQIPENGEIKIPENIDIKKIHMHTNNTEREVIEYHNKQYDLYIENHKQIFSDAYSEGE